MPVLNKILTTKAANLMMCLPLNETTGIVALNNAPGRPGYNTIQNPGFEVAGTGGLDPFAQWGEVQGTGAIDDELALFHSGAHAAKLTAGAGANTLVYNVLSVTPGVLYDLTFWTRGDGANGGRYVVYDNTNGVYIKVMTPTGVTGAIYTQVSCHFTAPVGCLFAQYQFYCPAVPGGICYYDDISVAPIVGDSHVFDGVYGGGYALGQPGYSGLSVLFDGLTAYVEMNRPAIANHRPAAAGSYIIYCKTTLAALIDGLAHWPMKFKSLDGLNYIDCFKDAANNKVGWQFRDDTSGQVYKVTNWTTVNWFSLGCTWSVANGINHYLNGIKVGVSSAIGGTMTHPMNYSIMKLALGADSPTGFWPGNLQNFAMWDAELTAAEMLRVGGGYLSTGAPNTLALSTTEEDGLALTDDLA